MMRIVMEWMPMEEYAIRWKGPWIVINAIQKIDFIIEDKEIRKAIEESMEFTIETLWEGQADRYFISVLEQTPLLSERPDIRINVAQMCYQSGEHVKESIRQVKSWATKSIVAVAIGDNLSNIPESTIKHEIEEYAYLFDTYESPWQIVDVIKDVPSIWQNPRINEALERAVSKIADGIRGSRYPLRIVETLLDREALRFDAADPPWVFRHEEINKAIRDSMNTITHNLSDFEGAPRIALQLAILDAGSRETEPKVPRISKRSDWQTIDEIRNVVDLKGWDYVNTKIAEQLKADPSYADKLVLGMPIELDDYFDERFGFLGVLGMKLVLLLFPYKPMGYITAMKVVYEIACTAKGHEWMWDEMKEELDWIEKESNLSLDDFI
jgi:hypothetical protein